MKYIPRDEWNETHLVFWIDKGLIKCAVPRDDIATQQGLSWKKFGLIGKGKTKKQAVDDWKSWKSAADFVSDIY